MLLVTLTGCGKKKMDPLVEKKQEDYEKVTHSTAEVKRGDFPNKLTLTIGMEEITVTDYKFEERTIGELTARVVSEENAYIVPTAVAYVKEGDHVNVGDVMVEATIQNADKDLQEAEKNVNDLALELEHNRNLMEIDPDLGLSDVSRSGEEQLALARTRLRELQDQKTGVSLVAKEEGTVTFVDKALRDYGILDTYNPMVKITSGSGKYTVVTDDPYPFREGEVFPAYANDNVYDFKLAEIVDLGSGSKQLRLEPVSDISGLPDSQKLDMVVEKAPYKDVVYVNKNAVVRTEDHAWVYIVDENGYREAREVVLGDTIEDSQIIESGLEGGEVISVE